MRRRVAVTLAGLGLACATTGCTSGSADTVDSVADRFHAALAAHDGRAGCALLAPETRSELEQSSGKSCPDALLEENVPTTGRPDDTSVFETMAQVRYAGDTVFLSRFPTGWRVMAAACTPQPVGPYDCRLSGG
jgi:hypothetical protein